MAVLLLLALAAWDPSAARAQSVLPGGQRPESPERASAAGQGSPFSTGDLVTALDAAGLERALLGSVPSGEATPGSLPLSLRAAVDRALRLNLGVLLRADLEQAARGRMIEARADLLPQLTAEVADRRLEFNFDASAFRSFGGDGRDPVVDYEIFDARLFLRAPLYDAVARWDARAAAERYAAAAVAAGEIRAAAVLFVANLYLQVSAQAVRVEAVEAQVETAQSLAGLARDSVAAGLAPAIDALRAEVRLRGEQQRLVAERNELAKSKLRLGRTIGLPPAQELHLTERLVYVPLPELDSQELVAEGLRARLDLRALEARRRAALAERRAARGSRHPVLDLQADVGELGPAADETRTTMGAAARLRIPLFDGRRSKGELLEADAELRSVEATLSSLRDEVVVGIESALLDAAAAELEVELAASSVELAGRQLEQARNRFEAGVGAHLEVVEAQETVARAAELEIAALLSHRLAKGALARAIGMDEHSILEVLANEVEPLVAPSRPAPGAGGSE
ncbi:MAG TPA: TolC family protein [Thermoanaerobaculia bacterium]|nr:TolC family protein [Thermoanaerobaculia bacterium]